MSTDSPTRRTFHCSRCNQPLGKYSVLDPIYKCPNCGAAFDTEAVNGMVRFSRWARLIPIAILGGAPLGGLLASVVADLTGSSVMSLFPFLAPLLMLAVGLGIYLYWRRRDGII